MSEARFKINGSPVGGFELHDTRHQVSPGRLKSARIVSFPGSRNDFVVKGRSSRGERVALGTLRAETFDALYTQIKSHEELVDASGIVAVTFHGTTYSSCVLLGFEVLSRPSEYFIAGEEDARAMVPARFVFRVVAA